HAVPGDDEQRLVIAVAEDVYAFRAVDLRRRDLRACRRLRPGRGCGRRQSAGKSCKKTAFHVSFLCSCAMLCLNRPRAAIITLGPGLFRNATCNALPCPLQKLLPTALPATLPHARIAAPHQPR